MKRPDWFVRAATLGPIGFCAAPGTLASLVTLPLVWSVAQLHLNFFTHAALLLFVCGVALFIIGRALPAFTNQAASFDTQPSPTAMAGRLLSLLRSKPGAKEEGKDGKHHSDPSEIVLDELVGCLVTFCGVTMSIPALVVGFLLFRFFDIFKPLGIHQIESFAGEWGIVLDDVAAGVFSCAILYLLGLQ